MPAQVESADSRFGKTALAAAIVAMMFASPGCGKKETVRLYAGAGLRYAVEDLIKEFEKDTGMNIEADYEGSGMLLSRVQLTQDADLFMPGDVWYVDQLQQKTGLVESRAKVALFVPVIIVRKGNPKNIRNLGDFYRRDVKAGIGDITEKGPRVGQICPDLFRKQDLDVTKLDAMHAMTVTELGNWVATGHVDAAVVWRAIAMNKAAELDIVEIPEKQNIISEVVIALMKNSRRKADAKKFMDFVVSPRGREILKNRGYQLDQSPTQAPEG